MSFDAPSPDGRKKDRRLTPDAIPLLLGPFRGRMQRRPRPRSPTYPGRQVARPAPLADQAIPRTANVGSRRRGHGRRPVPRLLIALALTPLGSQRHRPLLAGRLNSEQPARPPDRLTLKASPPAGQSLKAIATTVIRSISEGSFKIAEATSVAAPMTKTTSLRDEEKFCDTRIRRSTPALSCGVATSVSGRAMPASTGGHVDSEPPNTRPRTSRAFSALVTDDRPMDDAWVVTIARKSISGLSKRCAIAH
jgi:hypothetical protein